MTIYIASSASCQHVSALSDMKALFACIIDLAMRVLATTLSFAQCWKGRDGEREREMERKGGTEGKGIGEG